MSARCAHFSWEHEKCGLVVLRSGWEQRRRGEAAALRLSALFAEKSNRNSGGLGLLLKGRRMWMKTANTLQGLQGYFQVFFKGKPDCIYKTGLSRPETGELCALVPI